MGCLQLLVFEPAGIFYDASLWSRWLLALLARMGWRSGFRGFAEVLRGECLQEVYAGRCARPVALRRFLRGLGLTGGQTEEVLAASAAWRRQLDDTLRPLPGTRKAVALIQQAGLRLAILADTEETAAGMQARLATLGLGDNFAAVVTSRDLGCTKPERQAYQSLQAKVAADRRAMAFVGHDGNDLAGAGRAGWLRIACQHAPTVEADLHLNRLEDLAALIQQSRPFAAAG